MGVGPHEFNFLRYAIDGGCLEHIFNVPQALLNCSAFGKPGTQIIHMLPASNCCGHGFWQFSPELFFSLYGQKNGYRETEVFLADLPKPATWFRVKPPVCRERVNVHSTSQVDVLVRTVLKQGRFSHSRVQQSDYVLEWEDRAHPPEHSLPSSRERVTRCLKRVPLMHRVSAWAYHLYRPANSMHELSFRNPHLEEVRVTALTGETTH
jgi:hypothetical protein